MALFVLFTTGLGDDGSGGNRDLAILNANSAEDVVNYAQLSKEWYGCAGWGGFQARPFTMPTVHDISKVKFTNKCSKCNTVRLKKFKFCPECGTELDKEILNKDVVFKKLLNEF